MRLGGEWLLVPVDLPVRTLVTALFDERGRPLGAGGRELTAEQWEAVRRREGRLLLSANAGSGKTMVLAERFVRSCVEDGIEPGRILAITFTDKAAGELRERVRRRFTELGRRDLDQATESAYISTIHGFCARVLRSNAVAAGLDPAFAVLDEGDARALRAAAFDHALAAFLDDGRTDTLDVAAAYGVDGLRRVVERAHDALRSAGETAPRLPEPPAEPDVAAAAVALRAAIAPALAEIGEPANKTSELAIAALARCRDLPEGATVKELDAVRMGTGANAVKGPNCQAYRDARDALRQAMIDVAAIAAWRLIDELLVGFAAAYAEAKRERSAVDYDDLELLTRDLLAGSPALAARYADRFQRIMVDEFQDTNPLQLDLLDRLDRATSFYVGDELQSIYGFRHASVEVFRARRAALARQDATATLATSFRSRAPLLDAINVAFGDVPNFVPLQPGPESAAAGPLVEVLLTDSEGWDDAALGELPAAQACRRAEARLVAQRVRDLVDAGTCAAGDVVVLLRASTDMATFERALEDQGFTTLASGGRGFWARQQVLDLTSYLAALANPRDEQALLAVLASPLVGVRSDTLALLGAAAREGRGRLWDALHAAFCPDGEARDAPWAARIAEQDRARLESWCPAFAAERAVAPRLGLDVLLERAIERTAYDEHVLRLPGGRRRLANVTKLVRLAAAYETRSGRDVRGFIDRARAELEAEAREPDAPVELDGLDAVRLMTVHAAKGLEFGVVVLADLGRQPPGGGETLRLGPDGRCGLKLASLDGSREDALAYRELSDRARKADREEDERVLYVGCTRARERLILSGSLKLAGDWPADSSGAAPIVWLAP
ncbi:MAG: ATP-dependent helicase/nuclease subunit, partial [Solirubrobacteraceae bacterium]|nr:ATP-dependent helicase/nuclease subunit [Solirubrobacteraceae bacterium]